MKRPLKSWDDQDAFTRWRHYLCCMDRAGARAKIKRRYRRGERHEAKREIRRELRECL